MTTPTPATVTRQDLIGLAERHVERLVALCDRLQRQKPVDQEALKKGRKLRAAARARLRRLTRPPKVFIHFHYHLHVDQPPGVTPPTG